MPACGRSEERAPRGKEASAGALGLLQPALPGGNAQNPPCVWECCPSWEARRIPGRWIDTRLFFSSDLDRLGPLGGPAAQRGFLTFWGPLPGLSAGSIVRGKATLNSSLSLGLQQGRSLWGALRRPRDALSLLSLRSGTALRLPQDQSLQSSAHTERHGAGRLTEPQAPGCWRRSC